MEYNNVYYGDAWCVKCKEKVDYQGEIKISDSGRRMAMGKCPTCGTKVNRILGKAPFQEKPVKVPEPEPVKRSNPGAIELYKEDGKWIAEATCWRRGKRKTFKSLFKSWAFGEAREWIESYERIELYK